MLPTGWYRDVRTGAIRTSIAWGAALLLFLAACSGDGETAELPTSTSSGAADPDQDSTTTSTVDPGASFTTAEGWTALTLGQGTKPDLALNPDGEPGVTWLFESLNEGFVAYAASSSDWDTEVLFEGYFYGPIGLSYDPEGTPNVVIHDHQAASFNPELGDLTRIYKDGSEWVVDPANDEGHDGWDSTIVIGEDGSLHAAGVDPAQFDRTQGIEYYVEAGNGWEVTQIGSGPISYQYNVSLALDPSGQPGISFYNDTDRDLVFARFDGDSWGLERPAEDGDVGKYSSLAYDSEGNPSISFFRQTGPNEGEIVFTQLVDGEWISEVVGSLSAFEENNARRNSSLVFDSRNRAHVVFSDTTGVWHSVRGESGWDTEQIVEADRPLGQLVSLAIDSNDTPHIAIYEVTNDNPLDGIVAYITTE